MSSFLIPNSIFQQIEGIKRIFLWGDNENSKNIHWKNWANLCKPKDEGGFRVRSIRKFNEALLDKQVWRMHCNPNYLITRLLKEKYFPKNDILQREILSLENQATLTTQEILQTSSTRTRISCTIDKDNMRIMK